MWFQVTSLSRGAGRSAPAAAAYRAGERLRDETRNAVYNHSARRDIEHREIILPGNAAATAPDWVRNRSELWNAAERREVRRNARVAREFAVALPSELSAVARTELARTFAQDLADRYGTVIDLASHAPRPAGDPRNFHAHLLATTRELTPDGLGQKASIERSDRDRRGQGLLPAADELKWLRAHWAGRANEALRSAGLEVSLDPRSLQEQGIDRPPRPALPMAVVQLERRGIATDVLRDLRANHPYYATQRERATGIGVPLKDVDAIQARARERWLAYRAERARGGSSHREVPPPSPARTPTNDRGESFEFGD